MNEEAAAPRTTLAGAVHRLGAKPRAPGERGLPKPEILEARLGPGGVDRDFNVYRQDTKHGDPAMAVLLLPLETVDELNREGWPVRPGDLGENVTTEGIAYAELAAPRTLRVGAALLRTTKKCDPCTNLYELPYVGKSHGPKFLRATLGRRGWYASVLEPGVVRKGDRIELLSTA